MALPFNGRRRWVSASESGPLGRGAGGDAAGCAGRRVGSVDGGSAVWRPPALGLCFGGRPLSRVAGDGSAV
jgi:hypothetical protein